MHLGFIRFFAVTDLQLTPSPLIAGPPISSGSASPTQPSLAASRSSTREGDSFTLHGAFSLCARGQPLRSRARCDWSPCGGRRLQSWHGTAPRRCYPGLREVRASKKERRKVALLPQDWGWDRPAPQGICHKCSVAPAFAAEAINPSRVLRGSDRNPARQHRFVEGALACGQGKLVGMKDLTRCTERQR